jgi:hypothetical protein
MTNNEIYIWDQHLRHQLKFGGGCTMSSPIMALKRPIITMAKSKIVWHIFTSEIPTQSFSHLNICQEHFPAFRGLDIWLVVSTPLNKTHLPLGLVSEPNKYIIPTTRVQQPLTKLWMRDCKLSFGHVILPVEQVLMRCVCLLTAGNGFRYPNSKTNCGNHQVSWRMLLSNFLGSNFKHLFIRSTSLGKARGLFTLRGRYTATNMVGKSHIVPYHQVDDWYCWFSHDLVLSN